MASKSAGAGGAQPAKKKAATKPGAKPAAGKAAAKPPEKKPRAAKKVEIDTSTLDDMFRRSCDNVAAKNGWKGNSVVGTDARKLLVGLPVPSFAVEMLLMSSCWPLGRVFQVIGEEGTGKSTFLYEFLRWAFMHDGYAFLLENENKDNAPLREAILQYNQTWLEKRLRIEFTGSMEDWIARFNKNVEVIKGYNEVQEKDGKEAAARKFGWRVPYIFLIDSLMATATDKRLEKQRLEGAPTQDYAREAILLKDSAQAWPSLLRNTSIVLGGTNHMKPGQDAHGNPVARAPGGKAIKFQEVLEIHMTRFPSDLNKVDRGGYMVSLFTQKNSCAPDKRRIKVPVLWETEETDDPLHPRKKIYWDWHTATTEALIAFMAQSAGHANAINAVIDVNPVKGRRIWSDALGFPEEAPVDFYTFGRAIDHNKEVRQRLRVPVGIVEMNHFRPNVPLAEIYEQASFAADDALDSVYVRSERDLSGFFDVADEMAKEVEVDRKRVAAQQAVAADEDDEDLLDGLMNGDVDD